MSLYLCPFVYLSAFYLIPIWWTAWCAGRRPGYALAIASAATWLASDSASGYRYAHPLIGYWNAVMLLVLFVVVAHLLSNLREAQRGLAKSLQERTTALRLLEAEIEERKKLEHARLQAERLAAIGKMVAQVAHEIRNPLTAISVRLHSLKKTLLPNSSAAPPIRRATAMMDDNLRPPGCLSALDPR